MVLHRLGNKARIAQDIIKHFPPHRIFIDMFFGAGGIFFNKPLADYNFCNDFDDDVFNLWKVMQTDADRLAEEIELMPVHDSLFQYWKKNKETDPIKKATRFLMLSNFGYMGKADTLRISADKPKEVLLQKIKTIIPGNIVFMCEDFRGVLIKLHKEDVLRNPETFIYADPPYLGTTNNYLNSFSENDTIDLFDVLTSSGIRFALSEFDHPVVLELIEHHKLNTIIIGERQNMKNRRTEILVTNYRSAQISLFDS